MENYYLSIHMSSWKESMINRLSNLINRNHLAAKISQVLFSSKDASPNVLFFCEQKKSNLLIFLGPSNFLFQNIFLSRQRRLEEGGPATFLSNTAHVRQFCGRSQTWRTREFIEPMGRSAWKTCCLQPTSSAIIMTKVMSFGVFVQRDFKTIKQNSFPIVFHKTVGWDSH